MTSPEYQAPTWVNEDDPAFIEGVSPDLGAGYLNSLSGAVEDHGQRLGAITPVVTYLNANAVTQDAGDNRYILQDNAVGFAPAEATTNALAGKQPLDADLTALAGLDSATAGTVASDGAGWVKKTYAQLKTALGLVKGDVGLGNVDNTSDANKPVSTATQTALDAKVGTADSRLTDSRTPTDNSVTDAKVAAAAAISADKLADGTTNKVLTAAERTKLGGIAAGATANSTDATLLDRANHTGTQAVSTVTGLQTTLDAKAPLASPAFTGTPTGITKAHVGLGSVDNTADSAKPVSTAQQTALDAKLAKTANLSDLANAATARTNLGLGSVDNTTDAGKPVSTAQAAAIAAATVPAPAPANYFYVNSPQQTNTDNLLVNGVLRLTPLWLPAGSRLDRLGVEVVTAGEAGAKFRLGVFADAGGKPGNLLVDAGQVAADATGVVFATIDLTLAAGMYWVGGAVQNVVTTQPTLRSANSDPTIPLYIPLGTTTPGASGATMGVSATGFTAALANITGTLSPSGRMPRFIARAT